MSEKVKTVIKHFIIVRSYYSEACARFEVMNEIFIL